MGIRGKGERSLIQELKYPGDLVRAGAAVHREPHFPFSSQDSQNGCHTIRTAQDLVRFS